MLVKLKKISSFLYLYKTWHLFYGVPHIMSDVWDFTSEPIPTSLLSRLLIPETFKTALSQGDLCMYVEVTSATGEVPPVKMLMLGTVSKTETVRQIVANMYVRYSTQEQPDDYRSPFDVTIADPSTLLSLLCEWVLGDPEMTTLSCDDLVNHLTKFENTKQVTIGEVTYEIIHT